MSDEVRCEICEYRKTLARLTDCHVWGEDCPRYEMCGTQPQGVDV